MAANPIPDQAYLRECLSYDPETGIVTWRTRPLRHFRNEADWNTWTKRFAETQAVSMNSSGHIRIGIDGERFLLHRVIWKWMTGEEPTLVDHSDCIKTNNRWNNLRIATASESVANRMRQKNNRSGYKGVFYDRRVKRWHATTSIDRKNVNIGWFDTAEDAHRAYCETTARLFGEFARHS